ncbi:hypothetical protein TYRP_022951 [Tyrophagus putrescentiae]|nr:hypothetical protein TYRP_022951 [Tyrophagus putrescentiae]
MDSSKRKGDAKKKKKNGSKRRRTNLQESASQAASSGASTAQANLGVGHSNDAQELGKIPLNSLPPELISLIAERLPIMDRLHFQQAFARDPEQAVNNIRNGLAASLASQRALYLLMDLDEYDGKYQYNYQLKGELPNALLPALKELPIASEAFQMITLPELERGGGTLSSIRRLKETFPNLVELKVVLRDCSPAWLTKLGKVVAAFSHQLTALQLLIFSDGLDLDGWSGAHLLRLLSHLNDCRFPVLRHFTLLFEDIEEELLVITLSDLKPLRLLSNETLEECYLRLPKGLIECQLKLLEANQRLQRLGLIAFYLGEEKLKREMLTKISPLLAAKIVHLQLPLGVRSRKVSASFTNWSQEMNRLEAFTSLRTLRITLKTDGAYLTLVRKLSRLGGSLSHLKIDLHYVPVSELTFCKLLSQLAPCSPSVTHLRIKVLSITDLPAGGAEEGLLTFSHEIFSRHLHAVRHFPNLQQLDVVFPRFYSCPLCKVTPVDDGRKCMEKAMQPFRRLSNDQLRLTFRKAR